MTHEERLAHEEGSVVLECRRNVSVREKMGSWDDEGTRQLPQPWERTRRLFADSDKRQEALKGTSHLLMGISPKGMLRFLAHPAVGFFERGGSFEGFLRAQLVGHPGLGVRVKRRGKGGAVAAALSALTAADFVAECCCVCHEGDPTGCRPCMWAPPCCPQKAALLASGGDEKKRE